MAFAEPIRSMQATEGIELLEDSAIPLPDGVIAVEYIESTGTQWIDSGVVLTSSHIVKLRGMRVNEGPYLSPYLNSFFGSNESVSKFFCLTGGAGPVDRFYFFSATQYENPVTLNAFNDYECGHEFKINGQTIFVITQTGSATTTSYIFARNNGTAANDKNRCRIAYFQILLNENLELDLIPVRFLNDDGEWEGAMYDLVSGEMFLNQGTGDFIIGPDVED